MKPNTAMTATLTVLPVRNSISYDTQHSVTLSVQDWLGIKTRLAYANYVSITHGDLDTAEIGVEILSRLHKQTTDAIEAAAEVEIEQ